MSVSVPRPSRAYWKCQAVGWSLYLGFTTWQGMAYGGLGLSLLLTSLATASGIALTHGARHLLLRWRWIDLGAVALAPRVIAASAALALAHVGFLVGFERLLAPEPGGQLLLTALFAVLRWTMVFFIWLAIYCGYALSEQRREGELRRLEAEKALKEAELRALRSQLHPHFLFNALNSIRALVALDPGLAEDAITRIARIMRYSLATNREQMVSFGSELDIVDDYLALEGLRLAERLVVERHISDEARRVRVPILLLQLLVENALKHGIAQLPRGGVLRIAATVTDGVFALTVENPRPEPGGAGAGAASAEPTRVGLANAEERLRLLYGPEARFTLDLSTRAVAVAHVRVPVPASYDGSG